jgi:hypothetical protein
LTQPTSGLLATQSEASSAPDLAAYKTSKDDAKLAKWVSTAYQNMKSARNKTVMQWNLNIAFYSGRQYLDYSPIITGKLQVPKAPPHRVRLTVNRVRPMVRTEFSRLTQQKPSASVIPATASDEDLSAAHAAEQIWESLSSIKKVRAEYRKSIFWLCMTGNSFIKTWWNSNDGPQGTDPTNPMQQRPMGDVNFACVTPYHIFVPDLRTQNIQDQPYVLNAYTLTVDKLKAMYGDKIKDMNIVPSVVSSNEILEDAVLNLTGGRNEPDSVMCYEVWIKPYGHPDFPKGGMVQVVGDNVLYQTKDGIPYLHGEFPFTKFEHIPTGHFYADSTITDYIPLQKEYNRTRSQITEAKNRMAKPQLLYAKGSIDPAKITTEPGLAIGYRPGLPPPTPMPLVPLPNYVLEEQDRILSDMEDISGQHQVSRGDAPPGVTAATAISYLQEKDDGILSHTFESVEEAWESIAKQTLNLVVQYWDTERTVQTVSADGGFDVLMLKGSDLKNSTDIRMEGGSSLPTSKAAKQAFIMDMMKMGFIDPNDGLKLLEMGGVDRLYERIKLDESQAQRENIKLKKADPNILQQFQDAQKQQIQQQMQMQSQSPPEIDPATGQPAPPPEPQPLESIIPVNSWDNHDIHVATHNAFRKTQEFELLPDSIKSEFESHVNMHLAAISGSLACKYNKHKWRDNLCRQINHKWVTS